MKLALIIAVLAGLAASGAPVAYAAAGVTYAYDGQGRVTSATYANGTVITYIYDTAGNIIGQSTTCGPSGC